MPIPSTKDVLEKRITFIRRKIEDDKSNSGEYFLDKGIRVSISNIRAFAVCVEEILIKTEYIAKQIGWLSNHDIRRSLLLSQEIITSPIISIDQIIALYLSSSKIEIPRRRISQALICGKYNLFQQDGSDFILNLFSVRSDDVTSPLSKLSIIKYLIEKESSSGEVDNTYVSIDELHKYFEPLGLSQSIINKITEELLCYRLIEPYDPSFSVVNDEQRVKITYSGKIHYEFALRDHVYITQMARRTPLRDDTVLVDIRNIMAVRMDGEAWRKLIVSFINYCFAQDSMFMLIPGSDIYNGQRALRDELRTQWCRGTSY